MLQPPEVLGSCSRKMPHMQRGCYLVLVEGMPGIPVLQLNKAFVKMVLDSEYLYAFRTSDLGCVTSASKSSVIFHSPLASWTGMTLELLT